MSSRASLRRFPPSTRTANICSSPTSIPCSRQTCAAKCRRCKMVCGDTMNYWIKDHAENLARVLKSLDALLINDTEVKMLAKDNNLVLRCAQSPRHGPEGAGRQAWRIRRDRLLQRAFVSQGTAHVTIPFRAPALPLAEVVDPTGAGDSFAGGFFGYIASQPDAHACGLPPRDVLRQRHGILRRRALWHRTPAATRSQAKSRNALRSSASSRTSTKSPPSSASKKRAKARHCAARRRSLRHETIFAGMVAALLSVLAFGYCFPRNMLLLYGDAVAHLHIARRLIDSLNPGIRQIGSVWLPFPHLLMMPFAARMVVVAKRHRRRDPVDGLLHPLRRRPLASLALLAAPRGSRSRYVVLRAQSRPAVHADHRHDRAALPLPDHLERALPHGVSARAAREGN